MTGIAPMDIRAGLSVRETLFNWSGWLPPKLQTGGAHYRVTASATIIACRSCWDMGGDLGGYRGQFHCERGRRNARPARQHHSQAQSADRSVLLHLLHRQLSRSGEYRLCRASHEQRYRPDTLYVRRRRGHLLHRLHAVRSAEQHDAPQARLARLDSAHHGHVGARRAFCFISPIGSRPRNAAAQRRCS